MSKLEQDIAAIVGEVALCGRNLERSAASSDQIDTLRKAA